MQGYAYYPEVNTVARVILVSFCVENDGYNGYKVICTFTVSV